MKVTSSAVYRVSASFTACWAVSFVVFCPGAPGCTMGTSCKATAPEATNTMALEVRNEVSLVPMRSWFIR
jgi:hypothetical protein